MEFLSMFKYENGVLLRRMKRSGWKEISYAKPRAGYVVVTFRKKSYLAHRIIYSIFHQVDLPAELVIDHINGIKNDNRVENLRLVTSRENSLNSKKHREGKPRGISWIKNRNRWQVQIYHNGKTLHFGRYKTEKEALRMYQWLQFFMG